MAATGVDALWRGRGVRAVHIASMTVRSLVVPGRYARLKELAVFVARAAEEVGLDEASVFHCQMAVDEACANIIEHGYAGEDRGDIRLTCELLDTQLRIELRDHGKTFVPKSVPRPSLPDNLDDLSIGGLGLYFIHSLMDEVEYSNDPDGNRLLMVKRRRN